MKATRTKYKQLTGKFGNTANFDIPTSKSYYKFDTILIAELSLLLHHTYLVEILDEEQVCALQPHPPAHVRVVVEVSGGQDHRVKVRR